MRSRVITVVTSLALVLGSGGAIAVAHLDKHEDSHGGAADYQYRPGKGCGDDKHIHARHEECKTPRDEGKHGSKHHTGGDGRERSRSQR